MNIYFRVDASIEIGTGHVMRCLALAKKLQKHRCNVTFISREHYGHLCDYIKLKGFSVKRLPLNNNFSIINDGRYYSKSIGDQWINDALAARKIIEKDSYPIDWLIIDHYGIDYKWEKHLRKVVKNIFVIDDLANRKHDCDLLLDQNYFVNAQSRYKELVPNHCLMLLGPQHIIFREEFIKMMPRIRKNIKKILVFMGGTDQSNETLKGINAFLLLKNSCLELDVVVGSANPHKNQIKSICSEYRNIKYYEQVENMAELMENADLAVGAGGTTVWERCYLGLPSIVISVAENQELIANTLHKLGIIMYLGSKERVSAKDILTGIMKLVYNNDLLIDLSNASLKFMNEKNRFKDVLIDEILRRKDPN